MFEEIMVGKMEDLNAAISRFDSAGYEEIDLKDLEFAIMLAKDTVVVTYYSTWGFASVVFGLRLAQTSVMVISVSPTEVTIPLLQTIEQVYKERCM